MASCYDSMTSWRHDATCRKCVSSARSAKTFVFFGFSNSLSGQMQCHKNYCCHVCAVDLVGQGRLTIILTISISVIRGARKIIFFCFPRFWVDKFKK